MKRALLLAAAVSMVGGAFAFDVQPAEAAFKVRKVNVKHGSGRPVLPLIVVQHDGNRWRVASNDVRFNLHIYVRVNLRYKVSRINVHVPRFGGATWNAYTARGKFGRRIRIRRTRARIANANLGFLPRRAVQLCHIHGRNRTGNFTLDFDYPLQVEVIGWKWNEVGKYHRKLVDRTIRGKIECQRLAGRGSKPHRAAPPPHRARPPFAVKSARMRFLQLDNRRSCPKKVYQAITFETNGPGVVRYRLRTSTGKRTKVFTVRAEPAAGGKYRAKVTRTLTIRNSLNVKFMLEVVGHAKATGWVPLRVACPRLKK